jgi:RNA polymerase sigma factor (sigma-70 family)
MTVANDGGDDGRPRRTSPETGSFHVVGDDGVEEVRTNDDPADTDVVLTLPIDQRKLRDNDDDQDLFTPTGVVPVSERVALPVDSTDDAIDSASADFADNGSVVADDDDAQHRNRKAVRVFHLARADGFRGPRWDELVTILAQYGLGVMVDWLISGRIFEEAQRRGRGVRATSAERQLLRTDEEHRQDLAGAVVFAALKLFRKAGRNGNGWQEDGGAAITTYFITTCLLVFSNEFNTWKRAQGEWRHFERSAEPDVIHRYSELDPRPPQNPTEPERATVNRDELARALTYIDDERELRIIRLCADGWTLDEVAEELGETKKDIRNTLRRIRRRRIRSRMEGNDNE